jgi:hypothetical protein
MQSSDGTTDGRSPVVVGLLADPDTPLVTAPRTRSRSDCLPSPHR